MLCVRTYEDLCQETIYNRNQFWYYVIIFNPKDLTPASIKLLDNLYYFHKDSGANCVYFIPGFINTTEGISKINIDFGGPHDNFEIPKYGTVQFYVDDFLDCYKKIEENNAIQWRYSGECELLLFNLDKNGKIIPNDFAAYNLDDIIRNNRTITPFIRYTINLGKDAYDKIVAKRDLDNFYAELIMPSFNDFSEQTIRDMLGTMRDGGFQKDNYYFLS